MNDKTQTDTHFIWLVDGRHDIADAVTDKVIRLANIYQAPVTLIVDERLRTSERKYWFSLDKSESLSQPWLEQQNQMVANLQQSLEGACVASQVTVLRSADFLEAIQAVTKPECNNILLIQDEKPMVRHPVFQALVNLPCSVLILTQSPWRKEMKILGAVDPLHEHARPMDLDFKIVKTTRSLAQHLRATWYIGHACFVPATFLQFKAKFLDIHRGGLHDFIEEVNVSQSHALLLHGMPERAITEWLEKQRADLLVIGFVARNMLMSHLVGSTTTALLNEPPTDMLLVKSTEK